MTKRPNPPVAALSVVKEVRMATHKNFIIGLDRVRGSMTNYLKIVQGKHFLKESKGCTDDHAARTNYPFSFLYSRRHILFLRELEKHLSLLKRQGIISTWHNQQIVPGVDRAEGIDEYLKHASLILLLLCSNFALKN